MSKRNAHYREQKKLKQRKKRINKIISTTIISIMSFSVILYTFLIVDKLTEITNFKQTIKEITTLKNEVTYLEGKYEEITKIISSNKKLKTANESLSKQNKNKQSQIENLENQINKIDN